MALCRIPPGRAARACGLALVLGVAAGARAAETLYNGIVLPAEWPPALRELDREAPDPPPYLARPPAVIPIDVGRQLFVDDFLVESTTLARRFHRPTPHAGNPVLRPDRAWEKAGAPDANAMPFSDGVWYDPRERRFKMWYLATAPAGTVAAQPEGGLVTGYATSRDGIRWEKPALDVVPGTNIVQPQPRDSGLVWLDREAADPARRHVMLRVARAPENNYWSAQVHFSADGIHWSDAAASSGGLPWLGDRSSLFYNPFRRVWVYSLRNSIRHDPALVGVRARHYLEQRDVAAGLAEWARRPWVGADRLDPRHPRFPGFTPQLYNLDAVAYESLLLGLFSVLEGPENEDSARLKIHKRNEILVGYSRDGYHWSRPDRRPFIGVDERDGAWNWGNVQSAGGGCLVVGDRLYFYYSGRRWDSGPGRGEGSTGLAFLRRDGFASMDAVAADGALTTRPVMFGGAHLFVNVAPAGGELRVEVLGPDGRPLPGFAAADCRPVRRDGTREPVRWRGARDLSSLRGQPVRFRFHLSGGGLYAFWVSADRGGASGGYVAAGGPDLPGARDLPPARRRP
ncbi:MAG: hypothetical protein JNG83_07550 [Opitutaceae bacterium]|nr:hypothetical protein [Opitutaceae bacterium]